MKLMKIISYVGYGLMLISVILLVAFIATNNDMTQQYPMYDALMYWTYFVLGASALLAVGMPIATMIKNPKSLVRTLISVGILLLLILICYLLSDTTPVTLADGVVVESKSDLILTDTGLFATYTMFICTVVAIAAGEIWKLFKK